MTAYNTLLEMGQVFEDLAVWALQEHRGLVTVPYRSKLFQFNEGESTGGVEFKFDAKSMQTPNLYIEKQEKRHAAQTEWYDSGIWREDNTWLFVIGNLKKIWVFSKNMLKGLDGSEKVRPVETATSKGYLLPQEEADKYAATVIYLDPRECPVPYRTLEELVKKYEAEKKKRRAV